MQDLREQLTGININQKINTVPKSASFLTFWLIKVLEEQTDFLCYYLR